MSAPVVTRFAPSPTGELHLGNARTALFNFLLARQAGGRFVLRIEDTDGERSRESHLQALCVDLGWLGLEWDLGPGKAPESAWRQSRRASVYTPFFQRLLSSGDAYPCYCTALELELTRKAQLAAGRPPRYAGTCRDLGEAERAGRAARGLAATLRFRVSAGRRIEFDDLVHGPHVTVSDELGDFVIRRADGSAAFMFCNAIDDALMQVSQVLRGDDHLTNTPRQLLVLGALGLTAPRYGHLSLLTGPDGSPLSKRHGAISVRELREAGYAPLAVCNQLFRLGHSTPDHRSLSLGQLAGALDIRHLQRASARFELSQLRHWQREWVQGLSEAEAIAWLRPCLPADLDATSSAALVRAVTPNVVLSADVQEWVQVICRDPLQLEAAAAASVREAGPDFFRAAAAALHAPATGAPGLEWATAQVAALRIATGRSGAAFYKPLRAALTGRLHGPELPPLLAALPVERARARLLAQAGAP